jgi:hypothetical protein
MYWRPRSRTSAYARTSSSRLSCSLDRGLVLILVGIVRDDTTDTTAVKKLNVTLCRACLIIRSVLLSRRIAWAANG